MSLLLASNSGGSAEKLYSSDVFSVQLRTGNGTSQSITTGFQPDFIWTKSRSAATGHRLVDSARGVGNSLESNSTLAQQSEATGITAFSSSGYSVGADSDYNTDAATYVDFVFRRAPKVFDVVSYTGNGSNNRQIPHSLGVAPGFITTKSTSTTGDWNTYHRSATGDLKLNTGGDVAPTDSGSRLIINAADESTFTVSSVANTSGVDYVAYLWAHDTSSDGLVKAGTFNASQGINTIDLGFEPQFLIFARTDGSLYYGSWYLIDTMRGMSETFSTALLINSTSIESSFNNNPIVTAKANGFNVNFTSPALGSNVKFIYLAIRRPNKPPKTGAEVFQPVVYTGTNVDNRLVDTGIVTDLAIVRQRNDSLLTGMVVGDRLRGDTYLLTGGTGGTAAEVADDDSFMTPTVGYGNAFSTMNGFGVGNDTTSKLNINTTANNHVALAFKRAPGFFDVVCYTGDTTGFPVSKTIAHNLGVAPEFIIIKSRSNQVGWIAYHTAVGSGMALLPNLTNAQSSVSSSWWNYTEPTSSNFTVGGDARVNISSSATYVAYLFATLLGISKVGSYTGNGTRLNIDCGFSSGARFFLVKAASTTGNWWVFDSARGIVSSFDPALALNSPNAEVTSADAVDPFSSGITVNQEATCSINVTGVSYIFLAIA